MRRTLISLLTVLFVISTCFVFTACVNNDITVKFDYGYEETSSEVIVKKGNYITMPETPTRDGYEFAGWYENGKFEKEFDFSVSVDKDTTIYADWVSNQTQDLFSWVDVEGGIKLSSVVGGDATMIPKDLVVPRVIDGKKVVELENELFAGHCYPEPYFELTTVKIPYGITKIGNYAFKDCYNLESVVIPETVTEIGEGLFKMSSTSGSMLATATLPSVLTEIPSETFYNCAELNSVNIPSGVIIIEDNAFYGCAKLNGVTLPNGLETIGNNAFQNCNVITDLQLPETLTTIGVRAFARCYKNKLTVIPQNVNFIGANAFEFNLSIEYLDIPSTVTTMEAGVFNQCSGAIIRTTLTENAEGWNSGWNRNITTVYDSNNNDISSTGLYFIQNGCKYLVITDGTDEHKYLSLEFCFNTDEKLILDTKINYKGTEYPVEEINRTAFNRFYHTETTKLIFNEGITNSKFILGDYALSGFFNPLQYIVLPSTTQPLSQSVTYNYLYQKSTVVYTTLTAENVEEWTYRENTAAGGYFKPTTYANGQWQLVNGEPTVLAAE